MYYRVEYLCLVVVKYFLCVFVVVGVIVMEDGIEGRKERLVIGNEC